MSERDCLLSFSKNLFWDADPSELSMEVSARYIIQRVLEYGQMNEHVQPYSLFASQLEKRLGRDVDAQCRIYHRPVNASSSPTIEEAVQLAEEALQQRITLQKWIDSARFEG